MLLNTRKIFVLLSLACYLIASSVAAVHAIPQFANINEMSSMLSIGSDVEPKVSSGPSSEPTSEASIDLSIDMASQFGMKEDCHAPQKPPCNMSGSAGCKIFCSVMALGIADNVSLSKVNISPPEISQSFITTLVSRQLTVDPRPPK